MSEIVSILSHADTTDKIEILKKCLFEMKKQNYKVLLSSHIEVPDDIKEQLDYFVYDKENPLILNREFPNMAHVFVWQSYPGYKQNFPLDYNHSYAVLKLIKNALAIANINGYEKIHFVNYDYVLYDDYILKKHSKSLDRVDLFSYYYDTFETSREHINTGLFSVRVHPYFELFKNVNSKEDFLSSNQAVFEKYVYSKTIENGLRMEREDQEIILSTHNLINNKSTLKNVIDDKIHVYLSKEENTDDYYIYINSTKGDDVDVEINSDSGELKIWKPIPYKVNLLKIPNDLLEKGISINIPKFNFSDFYTKETNFANCQIDDRSLIQDIQYEVYRKKSIHDYCNSEYFRFDLINHLISKNGYKRYLEIGVYNGDNISRINIEHRDGVDPGAEGVYSDYVNYQMTSDDFFSSIEENQTYDIIFIDGLHHADQVDKDIQNSLNHLNSDGIILLHDCNPPEEFLQIVPRQSDLWNGDVWKSIAKLRCSESNLDVCVVDTDWGIGVIKRGTQKIHNTEISKCLNWEYFDKNRVGLMNLISVDDFFKKYLNN